MHPPCTHYPLPPHNFSTSIEWSRKRKWIRSDDHFFFWTVNRKDPVGSDSKLKTTSKQVMLRIVGSVTFCTDLSGSSGHYQLPQKWASISMSSV